jgi:hypothetical protein
MNHCGHTKILRKVEIERNLSKIYPTRLNLFELIVVNQVHLKIVNERQTRHGDYRKGVNGKHEITVNSNLNKYKFLITLIHEISHLVAFEKFGRNIKPHGNEWKYSFQRLMIPYTEIFQVSCYLMADISKPNGSTDNSLSLALKML